MAFARSSLILANSFLPVNSLYFKGLSMSVIADLCIWLLIDTVLGFLLYLTGCLILKVFTLGRFKVAFKDFTTFKGVKSKKVTSIIVLGISFYVLIIAFIAYYNS